MNIGAVDHTLCTFLRKSEKFEILSDHGPCRGVYLDTQMRESNSVKSSCIRKGSLVWEAIFNANPRHCDSLDFKMVCLLISKYPRRAVSCKAVLLYLFNAFTLALAAI